MSWYFFRFLIRRLKEETLIAGGEGQGLGLFEMIPVKYKRANGTTAHGVEGFKLGASDWRIFRG
jgi:hypothetical protein